MYYYLTQQVQDRFIEAVRNYWSYHPKYKDLVHNIQGKYGHQERPQEGIIFKNSSGNHVNLSADNFVGHIQSYVYLAHVEGYPGVSIEWVRENSIAIRKNAGVFPSDPGIYYIDFCEQGKPVEDRFYVHPLLNRYNETLLQTGSNQYQVLSGCFVPGTLRVYQMPGNLELFEGVNYTGDPSTGILEMILPVDSDSYLSADYRFEGEKTGPWKVENETALIEPIPGAVLAFGRRLTPGDRLAVVVENRRQLVAQEYGGRWELSLDMEVIARDPMAQREITDQTAMYIWSVLRSQLVSHGIEIMSISLGGDSEDQYDPVSDEWFYMGSVSLQLQTEWALHVPIGATIRYVEPGGSEYLQQIASLGPEELARLQNNFRSLSSFGLRPALDPFYLDKRERYRYGTFEMLV